MDKEKRESIAKELVAKSTDLYAILTSLRDVGLAETERKVKALRAEGKRPSDMLEQNEDDF